MSGKTLAVLLGCFLVSGCESNETATVDMAAADGAAQDMSRADHRAPDAAAADSVTMDVAMADTAVDDHGLAMDAASVDTAQPMDAGSPDSPAAAPDSAPPALSGCIKGTFKTYFGNLHSHSSYSDGKKTPKDAFQHARDVAKLDILAVTDHLEQLYLPIPLDRYGKCKSQASAETKAGKFLATCGFEYGSAFTSSLSSAGHANVFFSSKLLPAVQVNFLDFYKSLAACKTCIGQFNHPGDKKDQHFNKFKYNAAADSRINLFEFNSTPAWSLFFTALDAGWHLSPVYNQDNHSADWGTKNANRSGLLMTALDLQSMSQAMSQRRTFMTEDKNASITMMAGSCWMGSIIKGAASQTLTVKAVDADSTESFSAIELLGKGQKLLATVSCTASNSCTASFKVTASQSPYFVARAKQTDGNLLVSAPIWISP